MGLDYDSLIAIKPDIILTMISAFGTGGPYANRVGFDGLGQAMSGNMFMSGTPDQPVKAYGPFIDFGTASFSAFGTMAALYERQKTGKGQIVEGSLFSTGLTIMNGTAIEQAAINRNRVATLNRSQTSAPADTFKTKDGWVLVQSVGGPLFKRWADLMGEDHWLDDERFKDDITRGDNGEAISERLAAWCAERTSQEVLDAMEEARLPAGPVLSPQEVLDDPHIAAKGLFQPVEYPGLDSPAPVMRTPVELSETPGEIRSRAPTLGEHTDKIMGELGYSAEEISCIDIDHFLEHQVPFRLREEGGKMPASSRGIIFRGCPRGKKGVHSLERYIALFFEILGEMRRYANICDIFVSHHGSLAVIPAGFPIFNMPPVQFRGRVHHANPSTHADSVPAFPVIVKFVRKVIRHQNIQITLLNPMTMN